MHVYRIDREKRRQNPLTGIGAYLNGGRWNRPGEHVIYTAGSRSLAILEMLMHLNLDKHLPNDRIIVEIFIPDEMLFIKAFDPGPGDTWRRFPYQVETQKTWANQNDGNLMVLAIPSAIVPQETNYLINPHHPSFPLIQVEHVEFLDIDQRLY